MYVKMMASAPKIERQLETDEATRIENVSLEESSYVGMEKVSSATATRRGNRQTVRNFQDCLSSVFQLERTDPSLI